MATRLLLTLLALLTGLAAQLGPAQARETARADTEIGAVASSGAAQRRCASVAFACPPIENREFVSDSAGTFGAFGAVPSHPTVLQGIDRARE